MQKMINVIRTDAAMKGAFYGQWSLYKRPSLSLSETKEPRCDDDQYKVEDEETEQNESVSPSSAVTNVKREEEIFSNGVRTVPASGSVIGVVEVSTKGRHKLSGPSTARLSLRWVEHGEFVGLACDLESVKLGGNHRTHDASVRIEVVQPVPGPSRDNREWNCDTTESREDGGEERVEQHRDLDGRRNGTNELRECDTE